MIKIRINRNITSRMKVTGETVITAPKEQERPQQTLRQKYRNLTELWRIRMNVTEGESL